MKILVSIRMLVVMPVMCRPPERTLLSRCTSEKGEAKLEPATRLVASVGEITMKSAGYTELPDEEHKETQPHRIQVDSGPKRSETGQVNQDKKDARDGNVKAARHIHFEVASDRPESKFHDSP